MSQFTRKFLRPAGDTLLLLVALSAANLVIGRTDPGWLQINPAPFLAIPVLIGARYGFLSGTVAGLLAAGTIIGGRFWLLGEIPAAAWVEHSVTLAAFPVLGALSGELRRLYAAKMRRLEKVNRTAKSDLTRLESEVDLLRESNRNLSQNIALHGSELAAIDVELRDILSAGNAGIFGNTLDYLRRTTGVEEAALFSRKGNSWNRVASSLHENTDPDLCEIGTSMAKNACEKNELITWAGLWQQANSPEKNRSESLEPVGPWLAALPWSTPGSKNPQSVLMVKTMPLRQVTWENFARISTICRWVAGLAIARLTDTGILAAAKPVKPQQFRQLLDLATTTASKHHLPSAILVLQQKADTGAPLAANFESTIAAALRPTDVFTKSGSAENSAYTALLPLAGQRDAADILHRIGNASGLVVPIDGHLSAENLWNHLATGKPIATGRRPNQSSDTSSLRKGGPTAEPA